MKRFFSPLLPLLLILLTAFSAHGRQSAVRILYVNDFHGFAEPYQPAGAAEPLGGIAYLAGYVDRLRREKPTLLLAAGDMIQGNNWANFTQGKAVVKVMNAMKFDALTVGNHEFDFGQEVLKKRISEARFPVLGANVEGFPPLEPYVVATVGDVRVAIIGVVTPDTPLSTHPRNVAGLKFLPPEDAVRQGLKELRGKAEIFVVLSHLGLPADRALAEKVPGIDVIVGGHSHTRIENPVVIGNTILVQAWEHAKALGVLDLHIKDGKVVWFNGYLQEIKPGAVAADSQVQKIVSKYTRQMDAALDEAVGETLVYLDGEHVRTRETNLGDLVADIFRETASADLALINGGSIRASIPQGKIRLKEVYEALPFDNYLVALRLSGHQVREALEHGVSGLEAGGGGFPQVSGLTFTFCRTAAVGARVKDISFRGKPLLPEGQYVVATNDFLVAGGDGYAVFAQAFQGAGDYSSQGGLLQCPRLTYTDPGRWVRDLVADYLKTHQKVAPGVEGRIKEGD
jgi:5'-nucleotidase/UDP-sugar diphosphatase